MILHKLHTVSDTAPVHISTRDGRIAGIHTAAPAHLAGELQLWFHDALVFPGLINSHDHLDFNLFPQLGNQIYSNYTEWGRHIHIAYKNEIAAVLKVPAALRSQWGAYKNLLCGVTSVVNHGPEANISNAPVTIVENSHCLHSVHFERHWRLKLNNPLKKSLTVNIHTGEGTDDLSLAEIDTLLRFNLLKRKLVGVHGVCMSAKQAAKFEALVWCPESNYFLLNETAQINLLAAHTCILFGTDSTLTGDWDIWNHLRLARETGMLSDMELFDAVTRHGAAAWQLPSGQLLAGKDADLVVARRPYDKSGPDAFFGVTPGDILLVCHKGSISLFDETLLAQMPDLLPDEFSRLFINGECKYVKGDLPGLITKIKAIEPGIDFPVTLSQCVPA